MNYFCITKKLKSLLTLKIFKFLQFLKAKFSIDNVVLFFKSNVSILVF